MRFPAAGGDQAAQSQKRTAKSGCATYYWSCVTAETATETAGGPALFLCRRHRLRPKNPASRAWPKGALAPAPFNTAESVMV
jgi:hypothetical protein